MRGLHLRGKVILWGAANNGVDSLNTRTVCDVRGKCYWVANAYGALRQAAGRISAPICGNRLWLYDNQIIVQRDTGVYENLNYYYPLSGLTGPAAGLHGGRTVEFHDASGRQRMQYTPGTGWALTTPSAGDTAYADTTEESKYLGTYFSPYSLSHRGDTSFNAEVNYIALRNAYPPNQVLLKLDSGGSDGYTQLAYSPAGTFGIIAHVHAGGGTWISKVAVPSGTITDLWQLTDNMRDATVSEDGSEIITFENWTGSPRMTAVVSMFIRSQA